MKAVDTNILVYASQEKSPQHTPAVRILKDLSEGSQPWAIPWPCIYEFLRVVTHRTIATQPVPISLAWQAVEQIMSSPTLRLLHETDRHAEIFGALTRKMHISGNLVHDAHIAALLLEHGISEILTADTDFLKFDNIRVINPYR